MSDPATGYLDALLARANPAIRGEAGARAGGLLAAEPMARPSDQFIGQSVAEGVLEEDDVAATGIPTADHPAATERTAPQSPTARTERGPIVGPRPKPIDVPTDDVILPSRHTEEQLPPVDIDTPDQTSLISPDRPPAVLPAPAPVESEQTPPIMPSKTADKTPETPESQTVRQSEVLPAENITPAPSPMPVVIPAQAVAEEAAQPAETQPEVPRPPDITINIGRIVVSTPTPASPKPVNPSGRRPTRNPVASLGEYLERRDS